MIDRRAEALFFVAGRFNTAAMRETARGTNARQTNRR